MSVEKYPLTILYIEDEKEIRSNYVKYLSIYYESVYEAADGEEAYEIYIKIKPDILIIDINIPKISGLELLKKIRKNDHTTKAIMLTACIEVELLLEATELKLTKYLVKPVSRVALKDALASVQSELMKFDIKSNKQIYLKENFVYNFETRELLNSTNVVTLTHKELELFHMLALYSKKIFTYNECIYEVWGCIEHCKDDALRTLVKQLRKKLPKETIKNISGIGYKIEV